MATDFSGISQGIQMADETNKRVGSRFSGLKKALDDIIAAHKAKQDEQNQGQQATQLLGVKGLMEGKLQAAQNGSQGSFSVPGLVDAQGNPVNMKSSGGGETVYSQAVDPETGQVTFKPIQKINKGDKVLPLKSSGMSDKDIESAAQLLASGKEAPGQLSGFSKQKQVVIDRASEINPDFNPQKADLAFGAQKSEMTNARIQGQKVNQANTLMATISGNYDPKTDTFNIPPSQHTEIAMGLARLLSPQGQVSENLTNQLQQGTFHQKLADVAIYFGADPSVTSGPTQSLIKFLQKQVDIQGQASQGMLDTYNTGISPSYKPIKQQQTQPYQSSQENDPLGLR